MNDPRWRGRVGVVINVEARGNREARVYLFQTSPGDAALVDLYARQRAAHRPPVRSMARSTNILPNDTDLTPFLRRRDRGL